MPDDYGYPNYAAGSKSYEPFRLVNVYKKAKNFAKTTYRKATYKAKETVERFEIWSRRAK